MLTVFALSSGRSGTHFLYEILRRNAQDCIARHEPYGLNPSMFGRPIYDHAVGDIASIRKLLDRKRRLIERSRTSTYVETSHAFLKSWAGLAPEYFPNLKVIHLIREPLKVAKSEAIREAILHRLHFPFRNYRGGDCRKYFRWALTGREPIFQSLDTTRLTRLQWYLIQWIEIENRALQFLDRFSKHADCFTLHSPHELNEPARVQELFDFLSLQKRGAAFNLSGSHNKNWRPTVITDDDRQQFAEVLSTLPPQYLEIFRREPYTPAIYENLRRVRRS